MPTPAQIEKYVKTLTRAMDLGAMNFEVRIVDDDSIFASVRCVTSTDYFLTVSKVLLEHPRKFQRWVIVHELMHTIVHPFSKLARSSLTKSGLSAKERAFRQDALESSEEEVVDKLSSAISPYLPLPDWS